VRTNRDYYDEFAAWYERERGRGYHDMLDELEAEVVLRHGRGARVLEAGCGTGLVLERLRAGAGSAVGIDLSRGMLAQAGRRGLPVMQADLLHLPFPDGAFDVVCSFKVLAHVERIEEAVAELARVTRPGGFLVLEFYNRRSLRYLVKRLKSPSRISERETDDAVYTRYDDLDDTRRYLPTGFEIVAVRGVRVVTPLSHVFRVALLGRAFRALEQAACDAPLLRRLGGFLVLVVRKPASVAV
jgi:ubiquinone/menaquinone biosynthesis C-methylase UbiE